MGGHTHLGGHSPLPRQLQGPPSKLQQGPQGPPSPLQQGPQSSLPPQHASHRATHSGLHRGHLHAIVHFSHMSVQQAASHPQPGQQVLRGQQERRAKQQASMQSRLLRQASEHLMQMFSQQSRQGRGQPMQPRQHLQYGAHLAQQDEFAGLRNVRTTFPSVS